MRGTLIRRMLVALLYSALVLQVGCRHSGRRTVLSGAEPDPFSSIDYVQLRPGWRVRVVIPLLKSGGYILPSTKTTLRGDSIENTGDEFVGYEKDEYIIGARDDGTIRLRFHSAELWKNGKTRSKPKPSLPLFRKAEDARYIRLIYLTRESKADHDMAIVASKDERALDDLTRTVVRDGVCQDSETASCTVVPQGIAVTPGGPGAPYEPPTKSDKERPSR